ncbi:MAG TPA: hypothetical protein VNA17_06355 [Pyrinomonadaceae bacterium]|nr:hypothetical protein [Pyrinomonadaceae bacterium]
MTSDLISINNRRTLVVATVALLFVVLGCGSKTPPPTQYVGAWDGDDGTLLTIRADGSGDYLSGGSKVTGGSVTIDEAAKTLKVTLASLGPTYTIDKPPTGDQMTLSGVVFKRRGGSPITTTGNAKSEVPDDDELQTLVKTTFLDFDDAIQSGDFSDFHRNVAKVWREDSSPDDLATAFETFVDNKSDYNFKRAVSPLDAEFSPAPAIEKVSGLDALVIKGYYPTKPQRANFDLKYTMDDGSWKLISINIKTTGSK